MALLDSATPKIYLPSTLIPVDYQDREDADFQVHPYFQVRLLHRLALFLPFQAHQQHPFPSLALEQAFGEQALGLPLIADEMVEEFETQDLEK